MKDRGPRKIAQLFCGVIETRYTSNAIYNVRLALNPFYDYRGYLNCRAYGTLRAFGLFYYYLNCRAYGTQSGL